MIFQSQTANDADVYFNKLNTEYPMAEKAYSSLLASIDVFFNTHDYASLNTIIDYIENGDGNYAFEYIPETERYLRILHILMLESKYSLPSFATSCINNKMLLQKYMRTLFYLRRILFRFSDDSIEDALLWLRRNTISIVAVCAIAEGDRINPDPLFYKYLNLIYPGAFNEQS